MSTQILTVSSKGQISLPVSIRKLLSIDTGDKLVAYTSGDVIMLKTLKLPSAEEFQIYICLFITFILLLCRSAGPLL